MWLWIADDVGMLMCLLDLLYSMVMQNRDDSTIFQYRIIDFMNIDF